MTPRVSVIIPVFNLGQYLDEAVDSVLAQTFQDFEILILDDGSTDPVTLERLARWDRPRTRLFRTPNQGVCDARNYLLERATGAFVCALDADDRLEPTYFEKALAAFEADAGLSFVSCWQQSFGSSEGFWKQTRCDLPAMLAECTLHVTSLVRTEAVREVGGFNAEFTADEEDTDFWITLMERGHRGTILPEVLFFYRRRPDSRSQQALGSTRREHLRQLVRRHLPSYEKHLMDVLVWREAEAMRLRQENEATDQFIEEWLLPIRDRRQTELARLIARRDALAATKPTTGEVEALRSEAERLRAENQALRDSMSWQVTAPLRAAWAVLLKARGQ